MVMSERGNRGNGHLTSLGRGGDFLDESLERNFPHCSVHWCCSRRVRVNASSRCDLGNSSRTSKEARGNANSAPGKVNTKTELGNFNWHAKSKARSGRRADVRSGRDGNTCCGGRKENRCEKARNFRGKAHGSEVFRSGTDVLVSRKSYSGHRASSSVPLPSKAGPYHWQRTLRDDS